MKDRSGTRALSFTSCSWGIRLGQRCDVVRSKEGRVVYGREATGGRRDSNLFWHAAVDELREKKTFD